MTWGCFTFNGIGTITGVDDILCEQKYIDIINKHLCPVVALQFLRNICIWQYDNPPIHKACRVQDFQFQNNLHSMVWLVQSSEIK